MNPSGEEGMERVGYPSGTRVVMVDLGEQVFEMGQEQDLDQN